VTSIESKFIVNSSTDLRDFQFSQTDLTTNYVSTGWISIAPQVETHLIVPIIFRPLFAYSSYNFYGAAIYIKTVFRMRTAFNSQFSSVENFCPKMLIVFDFVHQKSG